MRKPGKLTPEEAFRIMEEESGTHFDPELIKVFLAHKEKYTAINSKIVEPKE